MKILPEREEVEVLVYILHLEGVGKENPEPVFKSYSMAESFNIFPFSHNLTLVVRIILPSLA